MGINTSTGSNNTSMVQVSTSSKDQLYPSKSSNKAKPSADKMTTVRSNGSRHGQRMVLNQQQITSSSQPSGPVVGPGNKINRTKSSSEIKKAVIPSTLGPTNSIGLTSQNPYHVDSFTTS